jgi:hypothetical protein
MFRIVVTSMYIVYTAIYFLPFEERFGLTKHDIAFSLANITGIFVYTFYLLENHNL